MITNYFVEASEFAAQQGKRSLMICDVDLALLDTMSCATTEMQRQLIGDWYDFSGGYLYFKTGRAFQSLDKAWGRNLPGSFEHHSMMRIKENGAILHLAPQIDAHVIGQNAVELIGPSIRIVDSPDRIHEAYGKDFVVYVEVKNAAVAIVHSLGLPDDIRDFNRDILINRVATPLLHRMGLQDTHRVVQGGDAIEIAPRTHSLCADAERILPPEEHIRIAERGLSKATGVHNVMALYGPDNVIPFMLGDSPGSDGPAMKVCEEYGGYGIGVANGHNLPEDFLRVTRGKIIPTFEMTWQHVEGMVDYLKARPVLITSIPVLKTQRPSGRLHS